MEKGFKNILIIKPSALGDVVMAMPALTALEKSFPQAKISWLVRPEFAPLLDGHPCLDEIIIFDRKFLGKAWWNPRAFAALWNLIRRLRKSEFDLVVDLQGLLRTALLGWLSGCKSRFGMSEARECGAVFYNHKIARDEDKEHVIDYYAKIVGEIGAVQSGIEYNLPVNVEAVGSVEKKLTDAGVGGGYAVLIPGSANVRKCWPVEKFAALADKMSGEFGLSIVVSGTPAEKDMAGQVCEMAKAGAVNFAGQTDVPELVALLEKADVVVSNDTGPGHIAVTLGRPMVLIFGPSNAVRLYPYGRKETVAGVDPFGRGMKLMSEDPAHRIDKVSVEHVFEKVCQQISCGL